MKALSIDDSLGRQIYREEARIPEFSKNPTRGFAQLESFLKQYPQHVREITN